MAQKNLEVAPLAARYVGAGLALVEIPRGRKGPNSQGWNLKANAITTPAAAKALRRCNLGLAHAWARTCAIDFDDLAAALETAALDHGLDLQEYLDAPTSVKISSGRENRAKLIYRLPEGVEPLRTLKIWGGALELRCASADGLTVQDVLPPSIHPDTQQPYEWVGDWENIPVLPDALLWFWVEMAGAAEAQAGTSVVAGDDDAMWLAATRPLGLDPDELRDLLKELNPDASYEDWLKVGMAIHHETSGSEDGLLVWDEWSAKGSKYENTSDLRSHWRSFRSTRAATVTARWLRKIAEAKRRTGAPLVDVKRLRPLAKKVISARYESENGDRQLLHAKGLWYVNVGTHYREEDPDTIRQRVWEYLDVAVKLDKDGIPVPVGPTSALVSNAVDALMSEVHRGGVEPPCWLSGEAPVPATDLVPLSNGLLYVPTRRLLPHTVDYFALNSLPFNWTPGSECPRWLEFLTSLWADDQESIDTLQEMFGYLITPDTRLQKAFMVIGPKRSGKGTIARVLRALLGKDNVVSPQLGQLTKDFGLQPLIGKLLAIVPDARLGGRSDIQAVVERILMITGEDAMTIDRKHNPAWTGTLSSRLLLMSNQLPMLADASGAVASRMIVLQMSQSFFGLEDTELTDALLGELPGILLWALEGRARLRERGRFTQPKSGMGAVEELYAGASPISSFVDEACEQDAGAVVERRALYQAWQRWCFTEGLHPGAANAFGRQLRAAFPRVRDYRPWADGKAGERQYAGLRLRPKWATDFPDLEG